MEWSPACGVLGVPVSLQCESQTGPVSCSITQLFAKVILDIPHALLLAEEQEKSDSTSSEALYAKLDVEFSEDALILKNSDGNVAIEAHPWGTLAPQSCQWHSTEDHSIQIILAKAPTSLGSWPYSFQSLVLQQPTTTDDDQGGDDDCSSQDKSESYRLYICNYDKNAFNKHSDALLASHIAESHAIKAAFAHAISEQMSTLPCGPLGQSAFLFPQQGSHCFEFLRKCCENKDIPAVRKLVRIAHKLTGIKLIQEEEEAIEAVVVAEEEQLDQSAAFYSLRNLVCCLIAGLAAVEQYRSTHGLDAIKSITACIGFGAGEYAAAVFAGALRLQDALIAIKAHALAFNEENSYQLLQNDIEECRSRAIDAVHAILLGENGKNTVVCSPRIRMYSGADGVLYEENNSTAILNSLPYGVCTDHAASLHRHDVRVALMQQGVAQMTVLIPEEGDESDGEEEEEEEFFEV